jgi:hypothetical protein
VLAARLIRDDLQANMALARVGRAATLVGADLAPGPDDTQERRELQGRLPNARVDAEAVPRGTSFVAAGVLLALASGVASGAEFGDVSSRDGVDIRDTWRHGLRSTFARL